MIKNILSFTILFVISIFVICSYQLAYGQIKSPSSYSYLTAGNDQEITWNVNGDSASIVLLQYSSDGGSTWGYIASCGMLAGSYTWVIPVNIDSWQCMVRIEKYVGTRYVTLASTGIFSIRKIDPLMSVRGVFSHRVVDINTGVDQPSQGKPVDLPGNSWKSGNRR